MMIMPHEAIVYVDLYFYTIESNIVKFAFASYSFVCQYVFNLYMYLDL